MFIVVATVLVLVVVGQVVPILRLAGEDGDEDGEMMFSAADRELLGSAGAAEAADAAATAAVNDRDVIGVVESMAAAVACWNWQVNDGARLAALRVETFRLGDGDWGSLIGHDAGSTWTGPWKQIAAIAGGRGARGGGEFQLIL
jgi:hypothetical protein